MPHRLAQKRVISTPEPAAGHLEGENAEDCPACSGSNPPYPFICPGDDRYHERPATPVGTHESVLCDEACRTTQPQEATMSGTNELDVTLLVMHRNESYPGQFAPEVLAVVDELTLDVNPEWWTEEIAKQKASIGDDASAWAEVTVRLPVETLMSALYPTIAPLNANIVATGQA